MVKLLLKKTKFDKILGFYKQKSVRFNMTKKIFCSFLLLIVMSGMHASLDIREKLLDSSSQFYVNHVLVDPSLQGDQEIEIQNLTSILSNDYPSTPDECVHVIKEIRESGKYIVLEDESVWLVGWRYRGTPKNWIHGQRLKISYHSSYSNSFQFENVDAKDSAWGVMEKRPQENRCTFILRLSNCAFEAANETKLILNNGCIFKGARLSWKVREPVLILHSPIGNGFDIWNLAKGELCPGMKFLGNEKDGSSESILNIENRLNEKVLGQQDVIKTIAASLFSCWAGFNDTKTPIGVFLFLGPTGVGKTELAKALTQELYKSQANLIRFDMSQFVGYEGYTRLIGSPPGYVNHEEGGQLTEALRAQPRAVVLLDEIEKAHPSVRKAFLPVFDEGFIADAKNRKIPCDKAIFIMTGNICSAEIAQLFNEGFDADQIMKMIEPVIIECLSPELYNRVTTLLFRPLSLDMMESLVNQKLNEVKERLKSAKNMELIVDDSAKNYLIVNGFHPTLGARPLKRLIQNKVVAFLSFAIINEAIPDGSRITLSYLEEEDAWSVNWTFL